MGATEMFFVDGELSAQITELAQFIGALKQVGDADKFAADLSASSDPVQTLVAESQGVLAKAPEDKVEAAYNQLFALAASAESAGIDAIARNVSEDVAAHADSGVAGLRVLNNLYNLADSSRAQVFSSMIVLAVRTHMLATLVPQISQLPKLLSEWSASSDEKADVVVALRNALDAEQLGNEAYEAELAFLEAVGAANAQSVAVATSAIVRFANLSAVCDIDALASLDSVQELSKGGKLGPAGDLLNALLTFDFKQWSQFAADKAALLSELG
ncbi:hypothetical protein H4S01_003979, partial [Coemansia sp. RSA 2610]